MSEPSAASPVVVVTGANGLVGSRTCAALVERGAAVRGVVRRADCAPAIDGVEEHVGDFRDPAFAREVLRGATAVVSTVHPMGSDRATQHQVGVEGTRALAEAARAAGVPMLVHISTAAVYDRAPGVGDVHEDSRLVDDEEGGAYACTKRDADLALEGVDGLTRVVVRPPAILGSGQSSIWNSIRPAGIRDDEQARHSIPEATFAWVHVHDLARLVADLATGRIATADDPEKGPVEGGCTAVNVNGGPATAMDYYEAVTRGLGVDPVWDDGPAWTGQYLADRAHAWGWQPEVELSSALAELEQGLRG